MTRGITQKLREWKPSMAPSPLPEPFEGQALRVFAQQHPLQEWGNPLFKMYRDAARAIVRKNALETLDLCDWTLDEDDAVDKLTGLALRFTFGAHETGPAIQRTVRDYCRSFITDLWPEVGRPEMSPGGIARNAADLRLAKSLGKVS